MLMDFGAGHYPSAARLTWQPLPPGTPPYRSPEAWLFERRSGHSEGARYLAGPADDMYALGVTAYRLVTGEYPLGPALRQDDQGAWQLEEVPVPSPRELNPRVAPQLSALILRMLSVSPGVRGTAGEIAEVLEAAAERATNEAEEPQLGIASPAPSTSPQVLAERIRPRAQPVAWRARSAWVLARALLVLWALQAVHAPLHDDSKREQVASRPSPPEGATANLGERGREVTPPPVQTSFRETLSQPPPPQPFPGQLTPDTKGHCPGSKQTPINGGCWVESPAKDAEECEKNGLVFVKDRCYAPVMGYRSKPPPTSAPPDFR